MGAANDSLTAVAEPVESLADVDQQLFREAISLFATGVTIITASTAAGRAGMTASAVCSLSLDPVQLLVCISERLPTHSALEESRRFAVNVLGEGQSDLARRFATPDIDKFSGMAITECDGIPLLDKAIAHFVCDVDARYPGGDHSIFIGNVRKIGLRRDSRPLLFYASEFASLSGSEEALLSAWHHRGSVV